MSMDYGFRGIMIEEESLPPLSPIDVVFPGLRNDRRTKEDPLLLLLVCSGPFKCPFRNADGDITYPAKFGVNKLIKTGRVFSFAQNNEAH